MTDHEPFVADAGWTQYKSDRDRLLRRYPELSLHIFATAKGVRIMAMLYHGAPKTTPRHCETIADATWQPSEVTPDKLGEWAVRALNAWLARRLEGIGNIPTR